MDILAPKMYILAPEMYKS